MTLKAQLREWSMSIMGMKHGGGIRVLEGEQLRDCRDKVIEQEATIRYLKRQCRALRQRLRA